MTRVLIRALSIALSFAMLCSVSIAEKPVNLTVQVRLLNGRSAPRKTASVEARFDYGDILEPTGEWSGDYKWIEVNGGETGTVWVYISYISERTHYTVTNEKHRKVKIRRSPVNGKIVGYVKKGQSIDIEQKIGNWGKTKKGWVDLDYFFEEGD